ncbi:hypothetical protein D7V96_10490 [bacterium D16-59]|nr:hypothetical protein D7V96_10490 [bacterium D16-59]
MAFSPDIRDRSWVCTIHIANMEKAGLKKEEYENPEFVADYFIKLWEKSGKGRKAAAAVCVSAEGRYHMHFVCYGNTTTLRKVSDVLFQSHVEPQEGGKKELVSYLLKEGKHAEKGEHVLCVVNLEAIEDKQGKRHDLEEIEDFLEQGYSPEEIFEESFRYRKYERMIKGAYLSKRIKDTPLIKEMHNEYHWGRSGTGKTYNYIRLCEKYSPDEVYMCNDYSNSGSSGGGFDFYIDNPAKIIVMDEFRGGIPYNQLLSILDVYSRNQQHCRYRNTYALWTSVIICSIYPPEKVYSFMVDDTQKNIDSLYQLMRRLNLIVYHYKNSVGEYREYSMPAYDYTTADDMVRQAQEYEKSLAKNPAGVFPKPDNSTIDSSDVNDILKDLGAVKVT